MKNKDILNLIWNTKEYWLIPFIFFIILELIYLIVSNLPLNAMSYTAF